MANLKLPSKDSWLTKHLNIYQEPVHASSNTHCKFPRSDLQSKKILEQSSFCYRLVYPVFHLPSIGYRTVFGFVFVLLMTFLNENRRDTRD